MRKFLKQFSVFLLVSILVVGVLPLTGQAKNYKGIYDTDYGNYDLVATANGGMVSTSHGLATQIGAEVLERGGNAIDAAIAIQYALTVVEPMMSGIGGGGFMMVYDGNTKETTIINSRERAPAGATPDMFLDEDGNPIPFNERVQHGTSVGVPGTLKGLELAHALWGSRSMEELIKPSITLAKNGFPVNDYLAQEIANSKDKLLRTAAKNVFFKNNKPLEEGDLLVQKDLAKTLTLISEKGADAFYYGEIGNVLAKTVQQFGGSMTPEDLANYNPTIDEPIWGKYQGYDIASMPPPSSGGVFLLQMLGILDGFDLSQYDTSSWEKYHLLAEAMHLAYADRAVYAGDPEFVNVPVNGLLNKDYLAERSKLIDLNKVNENPTAGDPWKYENSVANYDMTKQPDDKEYGETTHFTVADKYGNVVSYTTTIEQVFGSGIMVPGYGFMLNNELTDFDAIPGGANEVQPNKRPLSSMTPTIVFEDGKPVLTVGSPGGPTIITSVLQTIVNVIEYDMSLEDAIAEPRIYTNNLNSYRYEEEIPKSVILKLNGMGHSFGDTPITIGNVQSILIDHENGLFKGVADDTRNGSSIGIKLEK
ncbi:gamma-glutamyltransferase [Lysinibacillus telephonicus]|uniref:Glutathione hydrolase proenzyme n=1 Tax=Lysinibacillus telephonicus TaxID=1714840 RepID=A0A431UCA0_9BACI|nr:gamma-glutamyltransferase [Lysinibacillus telephonicus]RTQ86734.1 gamma-glutamyltransferase [Lysinibacillus telephonicus]